MPYMLVKSVGSVERSIYIPSKDNEKSNDDIASQVTMSNTVASVESGQILLNSMPEYTISVLFIYILRLILYVPYMLLVYIHNSNKITYIPLYHDTKNDHNDIKQKIEKNRSNKIIVIHDDKAKLHSVCDYYVAHSSHAIVIWYISGLWMFDISLSRQFGHYVILEMLDENDIKYPISSVIYLIRAIFIFVTLFCFFSPIQYFDLYLNAIATALIKIGF